MFELLSAPDTLSNPKKRSEGEDESSDEEEECVYEKEGVSLLKVPLL